MFDYQAGEKFKLTLIMVGFAGLMAGMFFTMLLLPTPEPTAARHRARPKYADNPDITGRAPLPGNGAGGAQAAQPNDGMPMPPANPVDPGTAQTLIQQWLPYAWDLSAGSAKNSQAQAMAYMTADCAVAYRQNIWTDDLAKQIEQSSLQSSFQLHALQTSAQQADGSVVVFVQGQQILTVPGKGQRTRPVNLKYLVKQTAEGIRIAGIEEGGPN